ncbi:helix-turn-helix domain-containing protein [Thiorhodococcus fuscus]|uniref:Helix-turn-helix domain-containing protein n=1 Tax=Thiorhodococcus fuscus TaxID=527200 RepID=A0ABW4Y532_9GAMM
MSLGKNIRRLRQDQGWTQVQLSERTGIRIGHISKLEKDDGDPKLSTLYKLMEAFGCSPDALLMDLDKAPMDAILKQTLERALKLPEANKAAIIEVVDGYIRACGVEQAFSDQNRTWISIWTNPPERVPMREPEGRQ